MTVKIPDDARRMITQTGIAYFATVTDKGRPSLSPKGTLKVLDDYRLAFADIASPGTIRNLRHCPYIEVNVLDPFCRRGYRFSGIAEISEDAELLSFLKQGLEEEYPMHHAVSITVEKIRPLTSPIYTFHNAREEDVRRKWEAKLGYRPLA